MPRPLDELKTLAQVVQASLDCETLEESIGYVCMWEEYRRTGTSVGLPCFGAVVAELLRIHGIDVRKMSKDMEELRLAKRIAEKPEILTELQIRLESEVAEDFDSVKSPLYDEEKHIDNLETLVVRLARYLAKVSDGDSKLAEQAMGYMKRQARGAQSILREG